MERTRMRLVLALGAVTVGLAIGVPIVAASSSSEQPANPGQAGEVTLAPAAGGGSGDVTRAPSPAIAEQSAP